ncbi:MAG: ABC transporter permease [Clostridiales bacterium]|nr:ABC transporter permease [Clostridiales bacterium]
MKRTFFSTPYIVWMIIFIVVPMLFIFYSAFIQDGHFTTEFVNQALETPLYISVLIRSIVVALIATALCLLIGYPVAYILSNMKKSTAAILSMFFILPMWMNFLLRTYAWQVILADNGVLNMLLTTLGFAKGSFMYTQGAVLLVTVYNFLPFMILPIYTILSKIDRSHIEAAHDLGANSANTFFKVVLPLSVPGVVSGITMVFIPAITTFAISRLIGGKKYPLYGDLIEDKIVASGNLGLGSVLSIILLVLVIISIVVMHKMEAEQGNEEGGTLW